MHGQVENISEIGFQEAFCQHHLWAPRIPCMAVSKNVYIFLSFFLSHHACRSNLKATWDESLNFGSLALFSYLVKGLP